MIQVPLSLYFTFCRESKASVQNVQELYPMVQKFPLHFVLCFMMCCLCHKDVMTLKFLKAKTAQGNAAVTSAEIMSGPENLVEYVQK